MWYLTRISRLELHQYIAHFGSYLAMMLIGVKKMDEIITPQKRLPAYMEKELNNQRDRMSRIAQLAMQALDEESEIYRNTVSKTISTIEAMNLMKQNSKSNGGNPEFEAWVDKCIQGYLADMEKIPQESCEKIINYFQGLSHELHDYGGFFDEVLAIISGRLSG
jgi:hypothetical protein